MKGGEDDERDLGVEKNGLSSPLSSASPLGLTPLSCLGCLTFGNLRRRGRWGWWPWRRRPLRWLPGAGGSCSLPWPKIFSRPLPHSHSSCKWILAIRKSCKNKDRRRRKKWKRFQHVCDVVKKKRSMVKKCGKDHEKTGVSAFVCVMVCLGLFITVSFKHIGFYFWLPRIMHRK